MSTKGKEFWEEFYETIGEMIFSDKIYVFKEIVDEPKTMKEISEATGIPYMTVRKYIRWAKERGLVTVAGTKKVGSVLAEKWLLTFIPEVVDVEKGLILRVKLKIRMRKEFCENTCPLKEECPVYKKLREGANITPYREVVIEKREFKSEYTSVCEPIAVTAYNRGNYDDAKKG